MKSQQRKVLLRTTASWSSWFEGKCLLEQGYKANLVWILCKSDWTVLRWNGPIKFSCQLCAQCTASASETLHGKLSSEHTWLFHALHSAASYRRVLPFLEHYCAFFSFLLYRESHSRFFLFPWQQRESHILDGLKMCGGLVGNDIYLVFYQSL